MSMFEVEYSNERILPNSGMALVGAILEQGGFRETLNQLDVTDKRSGNQIKSVHSTGSGLSHCPLLLL